MIFILIPLLALLGAQPLPAAGSTDATAAQVESTESTSVDNEIRAELERIGIRTFASTIEAVAFEVPMLDGNMRSLDEYEGEFVFLNFWATWCGPCREEMPAMERLQAALGDAPVRIVAVNVQESRDAAQAFVDEFGYTFDVLLDQSGQIAQRYGVRGLPTTYFVSPSGAVVGGLLGTRMWDEPEIIAAMRSIGEAASR